MADSKEDAEDDEDRNSEIIQKVCAYCNKKVVDYIKCLQCKRLYHKSCAARLKNFKTITTIWGLCCYDNSVEQNLVLITTLIKENEAKNTEIKLLTRLNNEIEEKNVLLKEKLNNLEKSCLVKTYANAVKEVNSDKKTLHNINNNIPSLIIRPVKKQNSTKTRNDLDKNLNPADLNIGVKNIKATKTGDIIIKCSSRDDIEKLKTNAEQKLKNNYEIKLTKLRNPRIKITEYEGTQNIEEIESSVKKQNNFFGEEDELKITYIKKGQKSSTIFGECSPNLFQKIMNHKKIFIGWQRYPVYEDLSIPKCFKCQGYYHKNNDSTN